jgi:hypothetical protein
MKTMSFARVAVAFLLAILLLAPFGVPAQTAYIDIEQRLTAEQLQQVGLSPAQLELLNRMLREAAVRERTTKAVAADERHPEPAIESDEPDSLEARLLRPSSA